MGLGARLRGFFSSRDRIALRFSGFGLELVGLQGTTTPVKAKTLMARSLAQRTMASFSSQSPDRYDGEPMV